MSSPQENVETKAGHAPALKVGGVRIAQRQRKDSEENSKPKEKSEKTSEDLQSTSFSPFKPPVLVTGIAPKVDDHEFVKQETKHAHEKPLPTHQPMHQNKPSVIQQPRK